MTAFAADPSPAAPAPSASTPSQAQGRPDRASAEPAPVQPAASADAIAAGNFSARDAGGNKYHLTVAGHALTSRSDIETFMIFRAAELTSSKKAQWFELIEHRAKGDKVPATRPDPQGPRFSFRLAYWRPTWRYKLAGDKAWKSWSPFSGNAFPVTDGKSVSDYEVSADIVLHKGMMDDSDPRDFDASALHDFLLYQVVPAK